MRDYVRRHFKRAVEHEAVLRRPAAALRQVIDRHARAGRVALEWHASRVQLSLRIDSRLGRRFFVRLGRRLERVLRQNGTTVELRIEALLAREAASVHALLARLSAHGDRVFVVLGEGVRDAIRIDSSRFNLVLPAR